VVLVKGHVCFGKLVYDTLAIKSSMLPKTKYLPLVTFFVRFLLLHSDQVDLLVGAVLDLWDQALTLLQNSYPRSNS
jgi:hypothetical protein